MIPAITVFGASMDVIFDIIHSERDTMAAFSLPHYKNAYLLTLGLLKALDSTILGGPGHDDPHGGGGWLQRAAVKLSHGFAAALHAASGHAGAAWAAARI